MTNEEAGRRLDEAERDLRDAEVFFRCFDEAQHNPELFEHTPRIEVVIPKASLMQGGLVLQRVMTEVVRGIVADFDLRGMAINRLTEIARQRVADAAAAAAGQRARLGMATEDQPAAPGSADTEGRTESTPQPPAPSARRGRRSEEKRT